MVDIVFAICHTKVQTTCIAHVRCSMSVVACVSISLGYRMGQAQVPHGAEGVK